MFLRIAARRGMDGTIQYGMGFDEQSEEDVIVNSEGVTVIVSPQRHHGAAEWRHTGFVELDPGDFRFIFINPNDRRRLLQFFCGTSSSSCGGSAAGAAKTPIANLCVYWR